jgi:putative RNA 2'-phosphotransferase
MQEEDKSRDIHLSKFLSYVLRHKPESIGLTLDPQGWALVDQLLSKSSAAGTPLTHEDLFRIVQTSDKKRFSLSEDATKVRAAQGHSVVVDLALAPQCPPGLLYHGTAVRFLDSILTEGLRPQARQQVHLSSDQVTAERVGQRHGKPVVLRIDAHAMREKGFKFFLADNGVWLVDQVPAEFLSVLDATDLNRESSQT